MLTWVLGGAPAVGAVRPGRDEVKEVGRPPPSRRGAASQGGQRLLLAVAFQYFGRCK